MTKLKCSNCGTLNSPFNRYKNCTSCEKKLFDATVIDI